MRIIAFSLFLFFIGSPLFAQDDFAKSRGEILMLDLYAKPERTKQHPVRNSVHIQQVGDYNRIDTQLKTEKSKLNYTQNGNYNSIHAKVNAKTFESTIVQNGDRHRAFDFSNSPGKDVHLKLNQQGNNHHFEKFGSNSIGDKIKFQMKGDSRSLIVRNFK